MKKKFRCSIPLLIQEAGFILNAFTANLAVMVLRLIAPFQADTTALLATLTLQGPQKACDIAAVGTLTMAQIAKIKTLQLLAGKARKVAKRAFPGNSVKLAEEFQVGRAKTDKLEKIIERAQIISASLKTAGNAPALAAKGWLAADTTAFDAALAALDTNEDSQEEAKTVVTGTVTSRVDNANNLYDRLLDIQTAADLEFPESVANMTVRQSFRLGLFPPRVDGTPLPGPASVLLDSVLAGVVKFALEAEHASLFEVWRKGPGETEFTLLTEEAEPGLYTDSGLTAGDYQYKVVGLNSTGSGPESEVLGVTVP